MPESNNKASTMIMPRCDGEECLFFIAVEPIGYARCINATVSGAIGVPQPGNRWCPPGQHHKSVFLNGMAPLPPPENNSPAPSVCSRVRGLCASLWEKNS